MGADARVGNPIAQGKMGTISGCARLLKSRAIDAIGTGFWPGPYQRI